MMPTTMLWLMTKGQCPHRVVIRAEKERARPMVHPQARMTRRCRLARPNAGRIFGWPGTEMAKAKTPFR